MTQEERDTTVDWAGEAKHLYRLADACRSERLSLIEAWNKWATRTAIEASDSGYKAILQGDPPGWDAPRPGRRHVVGVGAFRRTA